MILSLIYAKLNKTYDISKPNQPLLRSFNALKIKKRSHDGLRFFSIGNCTLYFFSGRAIDSRICVSAITFFIL